MFCFFLLLQKCFVPIEHNEYLAPDPCWVYSILKKHTLKVHSSTLGALSRERSSLTYKWSEVKKLSLFPWPNKLVSNTS